MKKQESKYYRLNKDLHELKQDPRAWNNRIDCFLKEIGFNKYVFEHGVYVNKDVN